MNELSYKEIMKTFADSLPAEVTVADVRALLDQAKETMSCYKCAALEVETKFRVLDERFSVQNERNPIESIKSRIKSPESRSEERRVGKECKL